jgi:hypothetical protein
MRLEGEFLERENIAKIAAQAEVLALSEEIISRQRTFNFAIATAVLLLVILAILLTRSNQSRKQMNLNLEQRVKERTLELEANRDSLLRTMDERDIVFAKVTTEIKSALATIKGLCSLGVTEKRIEDRTAYIQKIDQTSQRLLDMLKNTFAVAKSTMKQHQMSRDAKRENAVNYTDSSPSPTPHYKKPTPRH